MYDVLLLISIVNKIIIYSIGWKLPLEGVVYGHVVLRGRQFPVVFVIFRCVKVHLPGQPLG